MTERVFKCPITGEPDSAPWTPEQAIKHGRAAYKDRSGCTQCQPPGPKMRYVTTNECVGCFTRDAHEVFRTWEIGNPGRPDPFCRTEQEAIQAGQQGYYNSPAFPLVCAGGPHFRVTAVAGSRCLVCEAERALARSVSRGPRALARRAGYSRYQPTDACPECGQTAERDVVTNKCYGCPSPARGRPPGAKQRAPATTQDRRRTPSSMLMEQQPDLVLQRDDARAMGFTVYRTGQPCRAGHTGWRYVSVGTCITCLRA